MRKLLGELGVRPAPDPALNRALLARWAESFLRERGQGGGVFTALLLRKLGGDWERGLRPWLRVYRKHFPLAPLDLNHPPLHPLWLEVPAEVKRPLRVLSAWAKVPLLHKEDRELLYLLKDSLMVHLWNEGRLRFVALLRRGRPVPPEEALKEAFLEAWEGVREGFPAKGYEGLSQEELRFFDEEGLPREGEALEAWAERAAARWLALYGEAGERADPFLLALPPRLLVPLLVQSPLERRRLQGLSWEEILAHHSHVLDPKANWVLTALVEGEAVYHMPYRKAKRYRLLFQEEALRTLELPEEARMGRGEEEYPFSQLLEVLVELRYSPGRFPWGLRRRGEDGPLPSRAKGEGNTPSPTRHSHSLRGARASLRALSYSSTRSSGRVRNHPASLGPSSALREAYSRRGGGRPSSTSATFLSKRARSATSWGDWPSQGRKSSRVSPSSSWGRTGVERCTSLASGTYLSTSRALRM